MELSRFHSAVDKISKDYKSSGIESEFNTLVANLNSLVANPGNPQVSQAFKDHLDTFRLKLESSALNNADGDLQDTLDHLQLSPYVGSDLFLRIRKVLEQNQLTPNLAATEIEKLRQETTEKLNIIAAVDQAFTKLKVEYWGLEEGQTEMLISLPIEEETKTLEDLAKEVKDWHRICDVVSETFDIERNRVTIRAVASGSILLYLAATTPFIFGVAKCLKGVNQILAEVIKMKSLCQQLTESKAPVSVLKDMEAHYANKAKTDLEELAITLVDEYYKGDDQGRKNELKTSLSIALQRLSHKLATGAKVNLRLAPPKKPKIEENENPTEAQVAELEKIEQFEKVQIEVNASKAALDYAAHATDLIAALPAPSTENAVAH